MIRTRKKSIGREPSLRDEILNLLIDFAKPMTAREIADHLSVNKTTPFRPLTDLVQMRLINKNEESIDGAEYTINSEEIIRLKDSLRRNK